MNKRLKGFTLMEVAIVIVLMGIVAVMSGGLLLQGSRGTNQAEALDELDWKAREGFERLSRELRSIRPTSMTTLTASQLSYTSVEGESVSFVVSGSTLTRNGTTLLDGISSFSFSYYTNAGAVTAVAANVRLIQFTGTFTLSNQTSPAYITAVTLVP